MKNQNDAVINEYEICLIKAYGVIIGGKDLWHILGFKNGDAFRKAVQRKSLPIPTFIPNGRRSRVARSRDIAKWLSSINAEVNTYIPAKSKNSNEKGE